MWRGAKLGLSLITSLIEPSQGWLGRGWEEVGVGGCRPHSSTEESAPTPCSVLSNEQVTFKCPPLNQSSDKSLEKTIRPKNGTRAHTHTHFAVSSSGNFKVWSHSTGGGEQLEKMFKTTSEKKGAVKR